MAKSSQVPRLARLGNVIATAVVRAGFKVGPLHLLAVRGRKSGQSRTTPIAVVEQNGKRYLAAPYGIVDWVRNLRAAGEAVLTRRRRSETVLARELPRAEAGLFLQGLIKDRNPFSRFFEVNEHSSLEDFERTALSHPVFLLETK